METMRECIFCNIIHSRLPATFVYEDEKIMAWHDIQPAAPTHILKIWASGSRLPPNYEL